MGLFNKEKRVAIRQLNIQKKNVRMGMLSKPLYRFLYIARK